MLVVLLGFQCGIGADGHQKKPKLYTRATLSWRLKGDLARRSNYIYKIKLRGSNDLCVDG